MIIFRITIGRSWIRSPFRDSSSEAVSTNMQFEHEVGSSGEESIVMSAVGDKLGTKSVQGTPEVSEP
jgi:hypothetical protein